MAKKRPKLPKLTQQDFENEDVDGPSHPDYIKTKNGYAKKGSERAKKAEEAAQGVIKIVPEESWLPPSRLGARLKMDIGRIGDQGVPTDIRAILSQFHRLVAPFFAEDGDSHFPCGVTRHALNPELSSKGGLGHVLLFYVCDAVLGYYAFERGEGTQEHYNAIEKIHYIASEGAMAFTVKGSDEHGFGFMKQYQAEVRDGQLL